MSTVHQTQPTIQQLLNGNEFSGALDLITTSKDILCQDLRGVVSFRHLSSQLEEIQNVIGTYNRDWCKKKVTDQKLG